MLARLVAFAVAAATGVALAQPVPAGYPADYAQTIAAANKEGKVVVYSALDTKAAQPLIKDFQALYPGIKVEYNDMNSTEMYNRFIAEVGVGPGLRRRDVELGDGPAGQARRRRAGADLRVARSRRSCRPGPSTRTRRTARPTSPPCSSTTSGCVDRRRGAAGPRGVREADQHQGRQVQGQGHDLRHREERRRLHVRRAGHQVLPRHEGPREGLRRVELSRLCEHRQHAGEGVARASTCWATTCSARTRSCARRRIRRSASCCRRTTRSCCRACMFIGKQAKNPNAAKLWVDYILSQRGQKLIGSDVELFSIRSDVDAEYTAASLTKQLGAQRQADPGQRRDRHLPRPEEAARLPERVEGDAGRRRGGQVAATIRGRRGARRAPAPSCAPPRSRRSRAASRSS